MVDGTYLVVELPDLHSPGVDFTATHPSCIVDLALARISPVGQATVMDAVMLARGAGAALPELLEILRREHGQVVTLEHNRMHDAWLGSFRVPIQGLQSPAMRDIGRFLIGHGLDMQWIRGEQGRVFVRGQVPDATKAAELADQLRGFLEALRIDADVALETASPGDAGPWKELVDRIRFHAAGAR